MYTLYGSVSASLPVTGNIKLIDFWLMHGLFNPFFVFVVLVTAKLLSQQKPQASSKENWDKTTADRGKLRNLWVVEEEAANDQKDGDIGSRFHRKCKVLIPVITGGFVLVFFFIAFTGPQ